MRRTIAGVIVGLIAWALVVTVLNWGLRLWLPGYLQAEPSMVFTLTMKLARLSIAVVSSLAAGALVRVVAPASRWAPWIVGLIVLALFLPAHVSLWYRFPIWYHLTFLVPLVPLVVLGARVGSRTTAKPA